MTNLEILALNTLAERLDILASLENASFNSNKEEDEKIKKTIRPYMMWFESVAMSIKRVTELSNDAGFIKKEELQDIIRRNL